MIDPVTYLAQVSWETVAKDIVKLTDLTYRVTVNPENINQVGAGQKEVGFYFTDNTGDTYTVSGINVDGNPLQIEVTDSFKCYKTPASDRTAIICKAVGDGKAPFLSPSMLDRLDKSARDKIRSFELDILWKRGFNTLSDVPSSYEGQAGKKLKVNDDEDGLEFYSAETEWLDFTFGDIENGKSYTLDLDSVVTYEILGIYLRCDVGYVTVTCSKSGVNISQLSVTITTTKQFFPATSGNQTVLHDEVKFAVETISNSATSISGKLVFQRL